METPNTMTKATEARPITMTATAQGGRKSSLKGCGSGASSSVLTTEVKADVSEIPETNYIIIITDKVAVFGIDHEVGAAEHVGVVRLPRLPIHRVLQILSRHLNRRNVSRFQLTFVKTLAYRPLEVLEHDVVVHHDAAAAEGLHLDPLEGLAQGGLLINLVQLKRK